MITEKNKMDDSKKRMYNNYRMNLAKVFASIIIIVSSALITISAYAQDKKDSSANVGDPFEQMLDYSRPGKYHQLLADLVGNWTWKGRHFSGNSNPDSNKVVFEFSGTLVRKPFANGRFFIAELTSGKLQKLQMPIQDGKMKEVNAKEIRTEGYDNVKKKFVRTLINNHLGSDIEFSEGTYDPKTKTIFYEGEQELIPGMKSKEHEHFIIHDNDHYTIEYYREMDGMNYKATEINYTRAKAKSIIKH